MSKVLFTSFLGVSLLTIDGIPINVKIAIALITASPGLIVVAKGYRKYSKVSDGVRDAIAKKREEESKMREEWATINQEGDRLKSEASKLESDRRKILFDVSTKEEELKLLKEQYEREYEKELIKLSAELDEDRKKMNEEFERRLKELEELEVQSHLILQNQRTKFLSEQSVLKFELEQNQKQFEVEKERYSQTIDKETLQTAEWMEAQKKAWEREKAIAQEQLENQRQMFEQEKANFAELHKSQLQNQEANFVSRLNLWEQQKQAEKEALEREKLQVRCEIQAEINALRETFDKQIQVERDEFEVEKDQERDRCLAEWEETNKKKIKATVVSHLKPAQEKIAKLERDLEETRTRLRLKDEEVRSLHKPQKVKGMEPHNLIARKFQDFFESRSVDIEITNAIILEAHTIIRFKIWHSQPISKVKEHLVDLMDEFKLADEPQFSVTLDGHEIQMIPMSAPYMGMKPKGNVLHQEMERLYTLSQEELPLDESDYSRYEAQEAIAQQIHAERMLSFVEPENPLNVPAPGTDITEMELRYIEFLMKWRKRATGQPCITNQNDLIKRVWGVSPGRGTDSDLEGESLRDRLKRILDQLEIRYRSNKRGKNE